MIRVLLILDEPTVGVDPQSRAHLIECIRSLQQSGTAIIYASHYMEEVQVVCTRAAIVDHGRLLACDSISALLTQIPFEVELRLGESKVPAGISLGTSARIEQDGDEAVVRFSMQNQTSETALNSDVTSILTTLEQHAVSVRSIRTHEPNLERLFLKLTGHGLRD
jgi:ABC-2 type transport system ATP-binding protein